MSFKSRSVHQLGKIFYININLIYWTEITAQNLSKVEEFTVLATTQRNKKPDTASDVSSTQLYVSWKQNQVLPSPCCYHHLELHNTQQRLHPQEQWDEQEV